MSAKVPGRLVRDRARSVDAVVNELAATNRDYAFNFVVGGLLDTLTRKGSAPPPLLLRDLVLSTPGRATAVKGPARLSQAVVEKRLNNLAVRFQGNPRIPAEPLAPLGGNLRLLTDAIGLSDVERQVLQFSVICHYPEMHSLVGGLSCSTPHAFARSMAIITNLEFSAVELALRRAGRLRTTGLLTLGQHGDFRERIDLDSRLLEVLWSDGLDAQVLLNHFVSTARAPTLTREDFTPVAIQIDLAARLLRGALEQRQRGVNLLLYGPTGTGKSELSAVLAAELGVPLLTAGRADEAGETPTAGERLTSLMLGNALLGESQGLMLFDEIEDLLQSTSEELRSGISKQWFNFLLETNPVPTIWTSNRVSGVDPAYLRRFAYAIELKDFSASQRRKVWVRHLGGEDIVAGPDLDALAQGFQVSPAQIGSAVAMSRLVSPSGLNRSVLEAVLKPTQKLSQRGSATAPAFDATRYLPDVVNTPADLELVARCLLAWRPGPGPGPSLCLYGPPGTGKSEYVRYLAHRMDRPLVIRRCSDILSMWVGGTETNIAAAFDEARSEEAVLLFDEADSFLQDRRTAVRSWETTNVNEFLQQLESFTGVVACTTNLFRGLDQAALRRFTFKIPFQFMRSDQTALLFDRTMADLCGGESPISEGVARELSRIVNLTPGDFAVVARRLRTLGETPGSERLLDELRAEVGVKEGRATRMGF